MRAVERGTELLGSSFFPIRVSIIGIKKESRLMNSPITMRTFSPVKSWPASRNHGEWAA